MPDESHDDFRTHRDPRGRVAIQYADAAHQGRFEARGQSQYHVTPGAIRTPGSRDPLSADQQADLLHTLRAMRPAMKDTDECVYWVDQYLEALTAPRKTM